MRKISVKKFGGTSVGTTQRIEAVAARIQRDMAKGDLPVVVVSAMSGETNRLVRLANEINTSSRGSAYDMLLASGEQVSVALLSMALESIGVKSVPLLAFQLGIETDAIFSKAKIQNVNADLLKSYVDQGVVPVVAGFQGVYEGKITTLGRGGSDTTAVALASALGEAECEIYTDVPAVFSADPRLVPKARELQTLGASEMMEMAVLGSKVLHFRCVELAAKFGVKIHLRSTFEDREGTWILPETGDEMEAPVVSAITHEAMTSIVKIFPTPVGPGFMAKLFGHLAEKGVVIDIITQSFNEDGQRLAFSVHGEDVSEVEALLKAFLPKDSEISILNNLAKLSAVGVGMRTHSGVAGRFFEVLDKINAQLFLTTTSDIKISAVIEQSHLQEAAQALHKEFGLDQ
ncbi:MAG: aspartate kinase [Bdellovibrionaceae bacterium]|nr:aspartate kinase [Pseudobdellovibrionaceae bacterium]|tara:strand:- start:1255 stop:2463 length:1209 start_codon:yes stop_codon:yes gene_type:complete